MDAHALLTSQGWRGTGHSLHSSSDKIGLSRPLLVSQKQNNLGVGKKQHATSDMWWMNAFDKSLKGLETTEAAGGEGVKVVQTITSGGLDMVVKGGARFVGNKGGLYASFVRGEGLAGSMGMGEEKKVAEVVVQEKGVEAEVEKEKSKKRKRNADIDMETKEERRARRAAKRAAKAEAISGDAEDTQVQTSAPTSDSAEDEPLPSTEPETETKEQRRERRRLKKLQKLADKEKEAKRVESKEKDVESEDSSEKKKKKKRRKEDKVNK